MRVHALLDSAMAESRCREVPSFILSSDARQDMTYLNSELLSRHYYSHTGI